MPDEALRVLVRRAVAGIRVNPILKLFLSRLGELVQPNQEH
jgi:hypothetical protein